MRMTGSERPSPSSSDSGSPSPLARVVIVNADDFGLCDEVNAGVVAAHDDGVVTSASLMVRWPAAADAVRLAAKRPKLSLGLHVDLGEWDPASNGDWHERYHVVETDDPVAVAAEVDRQLAEFERLTGRLPTHLDGHQHVQRLDPARSILVAAADGLGVPLRLHDPRVLYRGDFYGQGPRGEPYPDGITTEALLRLLSSLGDGWSEIGCHPGRGVSTAMSAYASERDYEVVALCDPMTASVLEAEGIVLASYADLPRSTEPAGS